MRTFEILPTEENIIESLSENLLGRNADIASFYHLLQEIEYVSAISIDGQWGSGKTFFVKQMQMVMQALNPMSEYSDEKRKLILSGIPLNDAIENENYDLAFYYDAWENDNDSDPLLSIIYQICKEVGLEYSLKQRKDVFKAASGVLELLSGRDFVSALEVLRSEDPLETFRNEKDLQEQIREFFSEILVERGNRMIVFVDELDRCNPSFAVRLLEKVKHYMVDERVTFVFSVNTAELQHTIKHYYGDGFDSCRYLDRFFDLQIELPLGDYSKFYNRIGLDDYYTVEKTCRRVIDVYNMQLREITRYYRIVRTAIYVPTHEKKKYDFAFPDGKARLAVLMYIVPVMVALRMVDHKRYDDFIAGKDAAPLLEVFGKHEMGKWITEAMLNQDESYKNENGKRLVTIEQKIAELYNAIFSETYEGGKYNHCIGEYEFDKRSRDLAIKAASMLSQYADYEI